MAKIRYDKIYKIAMIRCACEKGQNVLALSKDLGIQEHYIEMD